MDLTMIIILSKKSQEENLRNNLLVSDKLLENT